MSLTDEDKQWIREVLGQELGRFVPSQDRGRSATKEDPSRFATRDELLTALRARSQVMWRELEEDLEYFNRRLGRRFLGSGIRG